MIDGRKERSFREMTPEGELVLKVRGGARPGAALILGGTFLMDSDVAASERELARRSLALLREVRGAGPRRVLVAGLGLGLTLQAVLADEQVASVDAVEKFAPVIAWNRDRLAFLNGGALRDPRVQAVEADLRAFLDRRPVRPYDLLLFDIDNGPGWLSLEQNAWLYGPEGLRRLCAWTARPGVLAFWAGEPSEDFESVLREERLGEWRRESVRCPVGSGERTLEYFLYLLVLGG